MYELLGRLIDEGESFATGNVIALDSGTKCWTFNCLYAGTAAEAPRFIPVVRHVERTLGLPVDLDDEMHATRLGDDYAARLRKWLLTALHTTLHSVDDEKYDWRRDEKVKRIGLPVHFRILRDTTEGSAQFRPSWNPEGRRIAEAWGVDVSAAAWLWKKLFHPESAKTGERASTRTIAVADNEPSRGAQGFSNVLTVAAISWRDDEPPEHGFVPHPESFGFCLDPEFREAMFSCHQYLKEELGLWPEGVALEWNLEMKNRVPVLMGGSAGAAFALAAGSLLARLQQREHSPA